MRLFEYPEKAIENISVIRQWVNDLRSGLFEQGVGFLCSNNRYCCLGVLCERVVPKEKVAQLDGNKKYDGRSLAAPHYVLDDLGICYKSIGGEGAVTADKLVWYNDNAKLTFAQIADIIEHEFFLSTDGQYLFDNEVQKRLEYLRQEIRNERISYGEICELQSLVGHIDRNDLELLMWAGVEENR